MSQTNILGVITARGGSKGIPGKNIKPLGGKPLISYTIRSAQSSKLITDLIVSTDDKEIARVSEENGARVPFIRPGELALDDVKHLPVMKHALVFMEKLMKKRYDYIVILQPTSPFRLPEDIDETLAKLIQCGADSAVSLVEIEENHPMKIKKMEGDRVLPYFEEETEGLPRQELPVAYKRSGAVYAMKRETLMEKNSLFGEIVVGYIVSKERSIDIDNPLDFIKAEYMLAELEKKGWNFNLPLDN